KRTNDNNNNNSFASVDVGDRITLQCFYQNNVGSWLYWFKKMMEQQPKLISSFYTYNQNGTFHHEFNNNPRFTLDNEKGQNHLTIFDIKISESATYYCASSTSYMLTFAEGTVVRVQGSSSNIPTLIHHVYWFKDSEESHPALIYTDGGSTDQCERKANTQTHNCDYNLPMERLNPSHAVTYYCAVASCGHILFGNGPSWTLSVIVVFRSNLT
uniref:Ig-like domain-containing protein n=1 Tax=Gasterosteus aculeatus aculeatus TaxID=481459 RepID=A0AAQ4QBI8_GASAC